MYSAGLSSAHVDQHAGMALLPMQRIHCAYLKSHPLKVLTLGLEVFGGQVHMHMEQICKIIRQVSQVQTFSDRTQSKDNGHAILKQEDNNPFPPQPIAAICHFSMLEFAVYCEAYHHLHSLLTSLQQDQAFDVLPQRHGGAAGLKLSLQWSLLHQGSSADSEPCQKSQILQH